MNTDAKEFYEDLRTAEWIFHVDLDLSRYPSWKRVLADMEPVINCIAGHANPDWQKCQLIIGIVRAPKITQEQ